MKKSNDTIGNRTRDLPACSAVPQPTAPLRAPKHVEESNKHIIEETVRQVGYLPELYEDARSEKYLKKKCCCTLNKAMSAAITF